MESLQGRLKERRKKKRLRALRNFLVVAVVIGSIIGCYKLVHRPGMAFGKVAITGTKLLNEADVVRMANSQMPVNLFTISPWTVEDSLKQDIRFMNAKASYKWPNKLEISVQEREPALYVANAYNGYIMIDYKGTIMSVSNSIPDTKAPLLIGEKCGNAFIGDDVANERVDGILKFLLSINAEGRRQIAELMMDDEKNVKLQLRNGLLLRLGRAESMADRAPMFNTVYNEIKDKHIQAEYIDLQFKKPYIKLKPELMKVKKS